MNTKKTADKLVELENALKSLSTETALKMLDLKTTKAGLLLIKIKSNERFANNNELADFLKVDVKTIDNSISSAYSEFKELIERQTWFTIYSDSDLQKVAGTPFRRDFSIHPLKSKSEFLLEFEKLSSEQLKAEFFGNFNLTNAEDGLILLRILKIKGFAIFNDVVDFVGIDLTQANIRIKETFEEYMYFLEINKNRLFNANSIKAFDAIFNDRTDFPSLEEFLDQFKTMSTDELLENIFENKNLKTAEQGLAYLQLMKNEGISTQTELAKVYDFNRSRISQTVSAARQEYSYLVPEIKAIRKGRPKAEKVNESSTAYKLEQERFELKTATIIKTDDVTTEKFLNDIAAFLKKEAKKHKITLKL